jgi:deoxyhypusine monooxygenase
METEALVAKYGKILNDPNESIGNRFRSLFSLKSLATDSALEEIGKCFIDSSELLKHELAYCLGQTKNTKALKILKDVLADHNQGKG